MQVVGIIVEYNPFHNGHLYHIQKSKKITGAEYVVAVMSGNFVQRGEPALLDKWVRAQMALHNGVDLVIELPVSYATASAELFAYGAVKLLNDTGIVNSICFGSEAGNISDLQTIASILIEEPEEFKSFLKEELSTGCVFPKARANAVYKYMEIYYKKNISSDHILSVLSSPNNILGIEYLKALQLLKSDITPYTINREYAPYHSTEIASAGTSTIASATAIRKAIRNNDYASIERAVPPICASLMQRQFKVGRGPIFFDQYSDLLQYQLRTQISESISRYMDNLEGLENRILHCAAQEYLISKMTALIKTKRYTFTHIQRALLRILLQIPREDVDLYQGKGGPQYIRILGFRKKSEKLLSKLKIKAYLPIVSNVKKTSDMLEGCAKKMLYQEVQSTDVYMLGMIEDSMKQIGYEFSSPIVIVTE